MFILGFKSKVRDQAYSRRKYDRPWNEKTIIDTLVNAATKSLKPSKRNKINYDKLLTDSVAH